ncbi:helix-turn-helix domain-containing protein [bacterium]|jgi:flagellar biosynthesis protein FlhG|nr:helix-turn-helix domain-containing protein [bacterium]MDX9804526.1 helix-turn-helix domain-containing protein [bacterium]
MVKVVVTFSPKGGAGTSVITANLAIYLAQKGKKVLLMDAALNGGTLHTYLNLPSYAVSEDVSEHFSVLPLITSDYQNLSFFSNLKGAVGSLKVSDHLVRWQTELRQSQFDFLFIDMGSRIDHDLLDTIGMVDYSIMFMSSDHVSIEKSNYFFKELVNYRFRNLELKYDLSYTVQNLKRTRKDMLFTFRNLLLMTSSVAPKNAAQVAEVINGLKIGIVYNAIRSSSEKELASLYQFIIRSSFGIEADFIGELSYSDVVTTSIATMKPVVTLEKNGEFVDALDDIASNMSQQLFQKKGVDQKKKNRLSPFTYYEMLGLDRGCSTLDINNQYEKLKKVLNIDNPVLRAVFDDEQLYVFNSLLESVYKQLSDHEIRKEYDMEIEQHLNSVEDSFPDIFLLSEIVKKYYRSKKGTTKLVKKDVFGREAERTGENVEELDFVDVNKIFEKFRNENIIGSVLKKIREESGISVKSIVTSTKISHFIITAIENDNYSQLHADIYVRGFLKNYCRAIKLNRENTEKVVSDFLKAKNRLMKNDSDPKIEGEV